MDAFNNFLPREAETQLCACSIEEFLTVTVAADFEMKVGLNKVLTNDPKLSVVKKFRIVVLCRLRNREVFQVEL